MSTNTNTNINTNTNTNVKISSSSNVSESQSVPKLPASGTADAPTSVTLQGYPEPVAASSGATTTKATSSTRRNDKLEVASTDTAVDRATSSSRSSKEVSESSILKSSSSSKQSKTSSKKEVYDVKTKTWTEYSDGSSQGPSKSRPTFERYVSKDTDGSSKVTYKKKIYDKRNNRWRVVDERTVDSTADTGYPEIVDDVINTTRTTYTTKVYDTKLGKWTVVDEKSFTDTKAFVPNDIAREIEKDNTDVANITTTTEVTKVSHCLCVPACGRSLDSPKTRNRKRKFRGCVLNFDSKEFSFRFSMQASTIGVFWTRRCTQMSLRRS